MKNDIIDYGKLVDEAMHVIVYKVLKNIEKNGLPGGHHFFISFATKHPKVNISDNLKSKYPQEMTIVLQYQYDNLVVEKNGFSVELSFNGEKESIYIDFSAITTFADPSVQFGLQFRDPGYYNEQDLSLEMEEESDLISEDNNIDTENRSDNVVSFDQFKKK
jgi:hypothetical protein